MLEKASLWLLKKMFIMYFKKEFSNVNHNLKYNKEQTYNEFMNYLNENIILNYDNCNLKQLKLKKRMLKSMMEVTVNFDITSSYTMIISIIIFFTSCMNAMIIKNGDKSKYYIWINFLLIATMILLIMAIISFVSNFISRYRKSFLIFYLDVLENIEEYRKSKIEETFSEIDESLIKINRAIEAVDYSINNVNKKSEK